MQRTPRIGAIVAGSLITGFPNGGRSRRAPVRGSRGERDQWSRTSRVRVRLGVAGGSLRAMDRSAAALGGDTVRLDDHLWRGHARLARRRRPGLDRMALARRAPCARRMDGGSRAPRSEQPYAPVDSLSDVRRAGTRRGGRCLRDGTRGVGPERLPHARSTRRWYDRAGRGWSEGVSGLQDGPALASDLHTLLDRAHVRGPYVLVGHSFGGLYALTFAARYPEQVAGIVLLASATHS